MQKKSRWMMVALGGTWDFYHVSLGTMTAAARALTMALSTALTTMIFRRTVEIGEYA